MSFQLFYLVKESPPAFPGMMVQTWLRKISCPDLVYGNSARLLVQEEWNNQLNGGSAQDLIKLGQACASEILLNNESMFNLVLMLQLISFNMLPHDSYINLLLDAGA